MLSIYKQSIRSIQTKSRQKTCGSERKSFTFAWCHWEPCSPNVCHNWRVCHPGVASSSFKDPTPVPYIKYQKLMQIVTPESWRGFWGPMIGDFMTAREPCVSPGTASRMLTLRYEKLYWLLHLTCGIYIYRADNLNENTLLLTLQSSRFPKSWSIFYSTRCAILFETRGFSTSGLLHVPPLNPGHKFILFACNPLYFIYL